MTKTRTPIPKSYGVYFICITFSKWQDYTIGNQNSGCLEWETCEGEEDHTGDDYTNLYVIKSYRSYINAPCHETFFEDTHL